MSGALVAPSICSCILDCKPALFLINHFDFHVGDRQVDGRHYALLWAVNSIIWVMLDMQTLEANYHVQVFSSSWLFTTLKLRQKCCMGALSGIYLKLLTFTTNQNNRCRSTPIRRNESPLKKLIIDTMLLYIWYTLVTNCQGFAIFIRV